MNESKSSEIYREELRAKKDHPQQKPIDQAYEFKHIGNIW